jgi:LCP family protein required for cell wall assembly
VAGIVASALAVVLVAGVSVSAIAASRLASDVGGNTVHLAHINGEAAPPSVGAIKGGLNLLLVGTDTRSGQSGYQDRADLRGSSGAGNNDVTILVHVAQDHQSAFVVSFPRDLMIPVPACPNPRTGGTYGSSSIAMLNSTLSRGGLACPVLTIEKLMGITIPYAASITFNGVAAMADAVGGVTVCVATPIKDPFVGLSLSAGSHTISGNTALEFLRSRHGVGDGSDLGRISNQQLYLSALVRTVQGGGVLTNPAKNMQLSDSLSPVVTMVSIALALKTIPLQNIAMIQYPVGSSPLYPNRVVPSPYADQQVATALQQDLRVQLTGQTGRGTELAPGATSTPAPSPTGSSTAAPAPTSTAKSIALPSTVQGQSADQQTCSKGNVLR